MYSNNICIAFVYYYSNIQTCNHIIFSYCILYFKYRINIVYENGNTKFEDCADQGTE